MKNHVMIEYVKDNTEIEDCEFSDDALSECV
jgi:hypothetical protein